MSRGSTIQSVQRKRKHFHLVIMKPDNRNNTYHSLSTTKWHPWGRVVIWDKQDSFPVICQRCFGFFFFFNLEMMWCHPNIFMFPKYSNTVKQMWSTLGTKHLYVKEIFSEKSKVPLLMSPLYIILHFKSIKKNSRGSLLWLFALFDFIYFIWLMLNSWSYSWT